MNKRNLTLDTIGDQEKPRKVFYCSYENCNKQFTEAVNLRTHIRIHVLLQINIDWGKTLCLYISRLQ